MRTNNPKQINVKKAVAEFSALWGDSLKSRYQAAVIYYNTVRERPSATNDFHNHPKYREWTSIRWQWLYAIGSGTVAKEFLDVHNYSLALLCGHLPLATQRSIIRNGLHLVSMEHPGGCIIPLRQVNCKMICHCFDIEDGGRPKPAEDLRNIPLNPNSQKQPIVFEANPDGSLRVRTTKAVVLHPELLHEILTHKDDKGHSVLTVQQLYNIIHELEA